MLTFIRTTFAPATLVTAASHASRAVLAPISSTPTQPNIMNTERTHPSTNPVRFLKSIVAGISLLAVCAVHADIIQPNTATASTSFNLTDYAPENTINGSGLQGAVGTLPNHDAYSSAGSGNHWTTSSAGDVLDNWIQWGFSSAQTLDTIYVWNHQSNGGLASNSGYDVGAFSLTFMDAGLNILGTYSNSLAFDSAAAQAFNFGTISDISFVRFDINGVQNASTPYSGLAEVAFRTASTLPPTHRVPDHGTTAMLLVTGTLGLAVLSRRRVLA